MRTILIGLAFAAFAVLLIASAANAHGAKIRACHSHNAVATHCH